MNFLLKKTGLSPRTLVGPLSRERELIEAKSLMFVRYYHPRPMDGDVNEMSQQFFETASALWKRNFEVKLLTPRMK